VDTGARDAGKGEWDHDTSFKGRKELTKRWEEELASRRSQARKDGSQ